MYRAIPVSELLDFLCDAVDAARVAAADSPEWLAAIDRAWDAILTQDTVSFHPVTHSLRIESLSRPGVFYEANGACQCEAFSYNGGVCTHRAAARLVRRALERYGERVIAAAPAALSRLETTDAQELVNELFA
jgi:hypothetical protein